MKIKNAPDVNDVIDRAFIVASQQQWESESDLVMKAASELEIARRAYEAQWRELGYPEEWRRALWAMLGAYCALHASATQVGLASEVDVEF